MKDFSWLIHRRAYRTGAIKRFLVMTIVAWSMMVFYQLVNWGQSAPRVVSMPAWVPFRPGFILVYLGMLLVAWLLPVAILDAGRFRSCVRAAVCGYLLVAPWWILTPTTLPRPPLPMGWWVGLYQCLVAMDAPNNIVPCAHGVLPAVGAWFVGRDRPRWRWALAGLLVVGLPSIALVWQHRPVDILLGLVAAGVGIMVGEKWTGESN
jgi:hypothetical protein